jgi:DNA-binding MarR family transcriptional regulator
MIAAKEGISQKALSEELLIDKATTAKAIRKLEEEGYVYRENDPEDNRYHLIFLTEFGKTSLPKIQKVINDVNKKSRAGIPDEQFELMMELLQKMLFNVSEEVHKLRDGENK